ncbi:uncharacterized protein CDAR_178531 [Caerostris darwini]|uniref:Toll-like receptor 2 n=1 Tax=Caerostris darwini TaxID=1538125 RepID=A0AAV4PGC4_9ARAC|nr:uncharacterized protein CDAR_178531 [Caerostris darwini]
MSESPVEALLQPTQLLVWPIWIRKGVSFTPNAFLEAPNKEETYNDSMYTEVVCKGASTLNSLEEVAQIALHRKSVDKLVVSNVPGLKEHVLVNLPNRWLKNTRITQFEIRDTYLSGNFLWAYSPFSDQSNTLLWISANRCSLYGALTYQDIGTVHTRGLEDLSRLEGIDFSFNHLKIVRSTAFRSPPSNLSTILLSRNSIEEIESSSFNYVRLKCLDVSHNLLTSVSRSMFASPAWYLENIDLSWNFLKALPDNFFTSMPALKIVNLSKNFLYSMPKEPWEAVFKKLTFLDLTGNFINCDCSLLWLLPILSPADANATSTPAPTPLPGQEIRGSCGQNSQMPGHYSIVHNLNTLKRKHLMC